VSRDNPAERRHPGPRNCFPSGSLCAAGFSRLVRDSAVVQFQVAQADVSRSGSPLTLEQRVQIRLASTYGIHQANQVVDTVHHAARSSAIFASRPSGVASGTSTP